ncbi:MAG: hypothetical protein AAGA93_14920 [Actinomycetota bacterium]
MPEYAFRDPAFRPPEQLRTEGFVIRPLVVSDSALDHEAVMETREFLRAWSQEPWPQDDFTVDDNRKDMETAERWFADRYAYLYTIMDPPQTTCLGCIYLFPPDARWLGSPEKIPMTETPWSDVEAVVTFWVRASRLDDGLDRRVLDAITGWFETAWPFDFVVLHTNEDLEQQVAMVEAAGLQLAFRLTEPDQPATSLAYAWPPSPAAAHASGPDGDQPV